MIYAVFFFLFSLMAFVRRVIKRLTYLLTYVNYVLQCSKSKTIESSVTKCDARDNLEIPLYGIGFGSKRSEVKQWLKSSHVKQGTHPTKPGWSKPNPTPS